MDIKNIVVRPINKGTLVAAGTFQHGDIVVSFKVLKSSNGMFVSLPQREYTDRDGNKKYAREVSIEDKDCYTSLQKQVLAAVEGGASATANSEAPAPKPSSAGDGVPF